MFINPTLKHMLTNLERLSLTELKEVEQRVQYLQSVIRAGDKDCSLFYQSLVAALKKHHAKCPPYKVFIKNKKDKELLATAQTNVDDFINKASQRSLTRTQRAALYIKLIQLIIADLINFKKKQGTDPIHINVRYVCYYTTDILSIIDRAFPEYLNNGMANIVLARML